MKSNNLNSPSLIKNGDTYKHQSAWQSDYNQNKLQQLICNESKFLDNLLQLLDKAITKTRKGQYENALYLLMDAQKILEYGANCGKIIDRRLIISILHNEAYCYQRMGDKQKSSKYIQAINYNLRYHIKSLKATPAQTSIFDQALIQNLKNFGSSDALYSKKLQLAKYQLQYCSLGSQMGNRKEALLSAKTAIKLYQQYFKGILKKANIFESDLKYQKQWNYIKQSLRNCANLINQPDANNFQQYIKIAKIAVNRWQNTTKKPLIQLQTSIFKDYSIGKLVDLTQMVYNQKNSTKHTYNVEFFLMEICHFSMAHFQMGTEYRLLAQKQYSNNKEVKQMSSQYRLSLIFHLLSITIIGYFFPCEILFMKQVIGSFEFHYKINISQTQPNKLSLSQQSSLLFKTPEITDQIKQQKQSEYNKKQNKNDRTSEYNKKQNKNDKTNRNNQHKRPSSTLQQKKKSGKHHRFHQMNTKQIQQKSRDKCKNKIKIKKIQQKQKQCFNIKNHHKKLNKNIYITLSAKKKDMNHAHSKTPKKQSYYFNNNTNSKNSKDHNSKNKSLRSKRIYTSSYTIKNGSQLSSDYMGHQYGLTNHNSKLLCQSSRSSRINSLDSNPIRMNNKKVLKLSKKNRQQHKLHKINSQTLFNQQNMLKDPIKTYKLQHTKLRTQPIKQMKSPSKAKYIAINNYYI